MSAREWNVGDPEPRDHPPLVDHEDVTWLWDNTYRYYQRRKVTHYPSPDGSPGVVIGSPVVDWEQLLEDYGPVREATTSESRCFVEAWSAKPLGGVS